MCSATDAADDAGGAKARWDDDQGRRAGREGARKRRAPPPSVLDDVPQVLPALARAEKLDQARRLGRLRLAGLAAVLAKIDRGTGRSREAAMPTTSRPSHEEMGDLLFAVANLARHLGVDPEAALRDANAKFTRRFHYVEARAREDGVALAEAGLERLDGYWNEIRARGQGVAGNAPERAPTSR